MAAGRANRRCVLKVGIDRKTTEADYLAAVFENDGASLGDADKMVH
jgi:hypothetical protein